jgi:RHS repeat-associated protein
MLTRPGAAGAQTMTWDAEGHLATSQDAAGTTSYVYDVDGNRLVRFDPAGATLYLPGQELRFTTATGAKKVTRYYTHASQVIAMRTATGVTWLSGDHHDTPQIAVAAVGQAVSIRRELPFGGLRGTTGTWPAAMDKGFVGGTNDNTGLTHLGAREYDPLIGRFISVDPVIDTADPQQLHGYAYANNAPITASDADGRWPSWKSIAKAAVKVVTAPGKFIYDHAGQISLATGIAALVCTAFPPVGTAIAPFLEIASVATGAVQAAKDCSGGSKVDCALGVASLVPGARGAIKGVKAAQAVKEADGVLDGLRAIKPGDAMWTWRREQLPRVSADRARAAHEMLEYEEEWNPFLAAAMPQSWRSQVQGWKAFKNSVLGAFAFREGQHQYNEYQERREIEEYRDQHRESSRGSTAAPVPAPTPVRVPGSRIYAI